MSVQDLTDFVPLAVRLVEAEGRNPEFLSISERLWDYLEEQGFNPESFSHDEYDDMCDYVEDLCKEVWDNG